MLREQGIKQVDACLDSEYKKYKERKKKGLGNALGVYQTLSALGSGHKRNNKENIEANNSPQTVTFGKLKEMNQSEQKLQNLMRKLGCRKYEDAIEKIERVNKSQIFLERVREMTEEVAPNKEPSLNNSWKIIKEAMSFKARNSMQDQ